MKPDLVRDQTAADSLRSAGLPLFSSTEDRAWDLKMADLRGKWDRQKIEYRQYDEQREALEAERLTNTVHRAQARAEEYLNALLIIVAQRGNKALRFGEAFTLAGEEALRADFAEANTAENRRILHTLLSAVAEVPENWSSLDLRRFLLGMGEQGKAKYKFTGKNLFKNSDWAPSEVTIVCDHLSGEDNLYAQVLRVQESKPIPELAEKPVVPPAAEYEIVPVRSSMAPEEKERKLINKYFIAALKNILDQRGLS